MQNDSEQPESAGAVSSTRLLDDNYANGKSSWHDWITSAEGSADRFGDRDVVPAAMARELAARLDQCYRDRMERHERVRLLAKIDAIENANRVLEKIAAFEKSSNDQAQPPRTERNQQPEP